MGEEEEERRVSGGGKDLKTRIEEEERKEEKDGEEETWRNVGGEWRSKRSKRKERTKNEEKKIIQGRSWASLLLLLCPSVSGFRNEKQNYQQKHVRLYLRCNDVRSVRDTLTFALAPPSGQIFFFTPEIFRSNVQITMKTPPTNFNNCS